MQQNETDIARTHCIDELVSLFNALFLDSHATELIRGKEEPLYLPKSQTGTCNQIVFAHGFFSSALHEIAHWCIAGKARRELADYGYWYCSDGRDARQQCEFQRVEVKPQALEWIFSVAAGCRFRLSNDNLDGDPGGPQAFRVAVHQQVQRYLADGLPARAVQFKQALLTHYQREQLFSSDLFKLELLR